MKLRCILIIINIIILKFFCFCTSLWVVIIFKRCIFHTIKIKIPIQNEKNLNDIQFFTIFNNFETFVTILYRVT